MKTFPFGLFLIGHISVFQLNDPKSMNFFYNYRIFCISCDFNGGKSMKTDPKMVPKLLEHLHAPFGTALYPFYSFKKDSWR